MPLGRPRASRVAVLLDFLIRRFAADSAPWTAGLPVAASQSYAPDSGMKYIPRETTHSKLKALAEGAAIVRGELRGS